MGDEAKMQKRKTMWTIRLTILVVLLWAGPGWAATVYVKNIAGTVYFQSGATSCDDITAADTAGDVEAAVDAAGSGGYCYVCEGSYSDTNLDSDGYLTISTMTNLIGLGTVTFSAGQVGSYAARVNGTGDGSYIYNIDVEVQDLVATNWGILADSNAPNVIISTCDITCVASPSVGSEWIGISVNSTPVTVTGCDVSKVRNGIVVYGGAVVATITNNIVHELDAGTDSASDGIVFSGALVDHAGSVVSGNEIYKYKDDGIDLIGASNVVVEDNHIWGVNLNCTGGCDGNGIKGGTGTSTGNIIRRNTIHDITNRGIISNDCDAIEISTNLIYGAVSLAGILVGSGTVDATVIQNTVVITGGTEALKVAASGTLIVQNNILSSPTTDYDNNNETVTGGYNCLVNDADVTNKTNYTNTGTSDLYATNPLFVSATDFHLKKKSPCRNAGLFDAGNPYSAITYDSDGRQLTLASGVNKYRNEKPIGAFMYWGNDGVSPLRGIWGNVLNFFRITPMEIESSNRPQNSLTACGAGYASLTGADGNQILDSVGGAICCPN